MTQRERMLAGQLYRADDPELTAGRARAEALCRRLEGLSQGETEARRAVMEELFGSVGPGAVVNGGFRCDYGANIRIGSCFYANYNCVILDCAPVVFGDHVFLGPNCAFYTAGHPIDRARRDAELEFAASITVEDGVWIGGNTVVLPGVRIGEGAVIGAGSVVTRDVPPYTVAAGNPCRVLRRVTPEDGRREYP